MMLHAEKMEFGEKQRYLSITMILPCHTTYTSPL